MGDTVEAAGRPGAAALSARANGGATFVSFNHCVRCPGWLSRKLLCGLRCRVSFSFPMANRHHYVSQVYLRRFEATPGKVWVYDKDEDRVLPGPTSTLNIGQEKGFYALPENPDFPDDDPEIIEGQLAAFEKDFVDSMDVAVRIAEEGGYGSLDERAVLSKTLAFQHVRTRAWRDVMIESYSSTYEQVLNTAFALAHAATGKKPPAFRAVVKREKDRAWALQAQTMWSGETINELAKQICFSAWIIARNSTERLFVTSDAPFAAETVIPRRRLVPNPANPLERIVELDVWAVPGAPNTQAFFPLTPRHALLVLDPSAFPRAAEHQGKVLEVSAATVDHINSAQVAYSQRWVYASTNDFSGAVPPSDYIYRSNDARRIRLPP